MLPTKLSSILNNEQCLVNTVLDNKNTYSYDKWSEISNIRNINDVDEMDNYKLQYNDNKLMRVKLIDSGLLFDKSIPAMKSNIKYKFSHNQASQVVTSLTCKTPKGSETLFYDTHKQMPMIKLFIAVYLIRKIIKYTILDNKSIDFIFYLFNADTDLYDKKISLNVDGQILVDDLNHPIIIDSPSLFDHLLLKAIIKLSNIMKLNIGDININSLVCACTGGGLFKMTIPDNNLESIEFTVEDILQNSCNTDEETEKQSSWISDNIIRVIMGDKIIPYNNYAKIVYELYVNNMLFNISLNNSLIYIISDMWTNQYGDLIIKFYNIFTGTDIDVGFSSMIHGLNYLGVICKLY